MDRLDTGGPLIVCASIPRCGSTYLVRSVAGLEQGGATPAGLEAEHGIRKTHRPPGAVELSDVGRAIFVFGDVAAAVVSTRRHRWDRNHFGNCGREFDPAAPIFDRDVLGYEAIFDGWQDPPVPTLAVRYRALGTEEGRRAVEEHLGRGVAWLPWRERRTKVEPALRERIEAAYASLVAKVDAAPDIERLG